MLNKEKFREEIWEHIMKYGETPAVTKSGFENCNNVECKECVLCKRPISHCNERFVNWLNSEYVELETDWTKVPVDTPIIVSDNEKTWHNRYFAKIENGNIYAWGNGRTSWSNYNEADLSDWKYVKLANKEDVEKYKKE